MTQYISKSALVAKIKNMKGCKKSDWHFDEFDEGYKSALEDILSFIDTLEVKEVDLDYIKKELDELIRFNKPAGDFGWGDSI